MNASPLSALRVLSFLAFPLTGLLAFAACNSPDDIVIGTDHQKVACMADADCPSNEPCIAGLCGGMGTGGSGGSGGMSSTGSGSCTSDSPCPNGLFCVNGACKMGSGASTSGGGCPGMMPTAEVCDGVDNDCNGMVDDNAACPNGTTCIGGACVMGGAMDGGGAGCPGMLPTPEVCDGIDNDCNGVVDDGALCGSGMCVAGACVGQAPCANNSGCPMGHVCINGMCVP
jgi:hypothetical protein